MESSGGKSEKPCSQPLCQTYLLPTGDHVRSEVIFPGVSITLPSYRHLQTCWWVWLHLNGIILLLSFCSFFLYFEGASGPFLISTQKPQCKHMCIWGLLVVGAELRPCLRGAQWPLLRDSVARGY